ncbi:MAG: hypothetical protein WBE04_07875, partial [Methyloceanibacter sp.]
SKTTKYYFAIDQAIDSAALNLYAAYQHIDPQIKLVDSNLDRVPIALEEFDVFYMGGRIQF